jgi:uncharacterized membrane protein (UPF0127 family)
MRSAAWNWIVWTGLAGLLVLAAGALDTGCSGSSGSGAGGSGAGGGGGAGGPRASDAWRQYPLDRLPTETIRIHDHALRVWLAREFDTQRPGVVQEGLMHVPTDEIEPDQGMLFVFSDERQRSFWMKNTIAPLDIAYARMNGTIVKIWQMPPLTTRLFPSLEPAMFALELRQGTLARLGVQEGDRLVIPEQVFKLTP